MCDRVRVNALGVVHVKAWQTSGLFAFLERQEADGAVGLSHVAVQAGKRCKRDTNATRGEPKVTSQMCK